MTSFTIVANNIKYLGVTLTKQVKDLYDKNFKSEERNRRRPQKMEKIFLTLGLAGSI